MQSPARLCCPAGAAWRARLLGLVLQALEEGGQRKAEAAVAHVGRQVRRQAQPLERYLRPQAASGSLT